MTINACLDFLHCCYYSIQNPYILLYGYQGLFNKAYSNTNDRGVTGG